jgi:hypothetical protein
MINKTDNSKTYHQEKKMRKRIIIGISIVALAALAVVGLAWARTAYAQTQTPPYPGSGYGMMGGQYGGFGMMGNWDYGPMHEYMVAALADALNLTPEEIQTRIDDGETPWQIAEAQGLSEEQIQQVMLDAHDKALDKAVEAGLLTQEQADWMDQHMESMWSSDYNGFGGCHGPANGAGSTDSGTRYGPMMRGNRSPSL